MWRTHLIGGDEGEKDEKRCGNGRSGVVEKKRNRAEDHTDGVDKKTRKGKGRKALKPKYQ